MTRSVIRIANAMAIVVLMCLSLSAIAPPQPPTANPATNIKNDSFTANWTAVASATSYRLDVSTDANFKTFVPGYNNLDVSGTSFLVKGLSCNNTYYYRVRAIDGNGQSANSMVVSVPLCSR